MQMLKDGFMLNGNLGRRQVNPVEVARAAGQIADECMREDEEHAAKPGPGFTAAGEEVSDAKG